MEKENNLENNNRKIEIEELNKKIFALKEEVKVLDESKEKLMNLVHQFHENNDHDISRLNEEMQFHMNDNKKMLMFLEEQLLLLKKMQHEQEDFYEDMSYKIDKAKTINEEEIEQTEKEIRINL